MKKFFLSLIFVISILVFPTSRVQALTLNNDIVLSSNQLFIVADDDDDFSHNCRDFSPILRMVGYIVFLVKIAVPLLIIGKSSLNLFSVVTKGEPSELTKRAQSFMISIVAGVLIFLLPDIVDVIYGVAGKNDPNYDAKICRACVFDPSGEDCQKAIEDKKSQESSN